MNAEEIGIDDKCWVLTPCENETQAGIRACGDAKRGEIPEMNVCLSETQKNPVCMVSEKRVRSG
jgi:hypothetical protein